MLWSGTLESKGYVVPYRFLSEGTEKIINV